MFDLEKIDDPSFVKKLSKKELKQLALEIREFLIKHISETGGHLASNLGVVEITIALYYVFDPEKDKFIFDVGHQSYVHKILTGRAKEFSTLRQYGGLSGYISREESKYDVWESGHSSTSISAMSGFLIANKENPDDRVVTVIGDCAMGNGVAFEGLNFAGSQRKYAPIIVLNDNKMGISKSVGAMSKLFNRLRGGKFYHCFKKVLNAIFPKFITNWFHRVKKSIKAFFQSDNIFEDFGFEYYGPINGNDINSVIKTFERIKKLNRPVVIHALTKKGCGYKPAENESEKYHGVSPFDITTGKSNNVKAENVHTYSEIVSDTLLKIRATRPFYLITPAMKVGSEIMDFEKTYPSDFFDVGIMEGHAATMAAGLAINKKDVVLLMYSTFAQRAYDEFVNDIGRQNIKLIIGLDRCGVVGEDGSTHQGIYDVAMFNSMPHFAIAMPRNGIELIGLFKFAFTYPESIVIRYPKGSYKIDLNNDYPMINSRYWETIISNNSNNYILSYGPDLDILEKIIKDNSLDVNLVNARFIKPVDEIFLNKTLNPNNRFLIIEQIVQSSSLFTNICYYASTNNIRLPEIKLVGFTPDTIIKHGDKETVLEHYGFGYNNLKESIIEFLKK